MSQSQTNKKEKIEDIKILFIGGVYEEGKEQEYLDKSKTSIQNAVNTHQWNIIKGLDNVSDKPLQILSARYLPAYPNYKEIIIKKNLWSHAGDSKDENIGFINFKILKNILIKRNLEKKAKKWVKNNKNSKNYIFCYYTSIPQMNAAIKAKKKDDSATTILIVPDIPGFLDLSNKVSSVKNIISKIKYKIAIKLLKKFDKYILLTEAMIDKLDIAKENCIIIEGMIDKKDSVSEEFIEQKDFSKKSIVYAGSLHEKYGMKNYLEAIKLTKNNDVKFYIFGDGELKQEIEQYAQIDSRVKFMGYQDRKKVLQYQRNATALINPRGDKYEYVKYSFPSKNLEYLISGSPVICCKLPCTPAEYDDVYIYCKDDSAKEIAKAIEDTLNKDERELKDIAKKALKFAIQHKEKNIQCNEILKFIKDER